MQRTWSRKEGYEVSTQGDTRFSALIAKMPDGRTVEMHYQCDVKGFDPGGRNWRLGKGRQPLKARDTWPEYLALWRTWATYNRPLMFDLLRCSGAVLRDRFATSPINQAHALAVLLDEIELFGDLW